LSSIACIIDSILIRIVELTTYIFYTEEGSTQSLHVPPSNMFSRVLIDMKAQYLSDIKSNCILHTKIFDSLMQALRTFIYA